MSRVSVLLYACLILSVATGYSPTSLFVLPAVSKTSLGQRFFTPTGEFGRARHAAMQPHHRRGGLTTALHADVAAAATTTTTDLESQRESAVSLSSTPWKERMMSFMGMQRSAESDGLTFRQRLTKTGVYFAMSYNIIGQLNGGCSMSIAWYLFSVRTGVSPLAPGQWKAYLAFYAGFWVANNFLRPFRVAGAVAMAPRMERLTERVQNRFQMVRKSRAATLTFAATYMTAVSVSASLMALATLLSGVPIFPAST